nr:hypothetical protein [Entomoplasma sp. MP1]
MNNKVDFKQVLINNGLASYIKDISVLTKYLILITLLEILKKFIQEH